MLTVQVLNRLSTCLAFALIVPVWAASQTPRPRVDSRGEDKSARGSIRGRVLMPDGAFIGDSLRVRLLTFNGTLATIFTSNQGSFEFPDLLPGNYEVEVEPNGLQLEVISQSVQVFRGAPSVITISLKDKASAKKDRPDRRSISVGEIGADVPKSAKKEFELASKAAQENRVDVAIAHLRKAISIYPTFVMALNDLGTQLLAQGKLEEAAEELRRAVAIDGKAFNPNLNLGIVLVQQQR